MKNRYVLLMDLPLLAVAAFGAFALRFDWLFLRYRPEFAIYLGAVLVLKPLLFYPFGMYARYWRYATAQDLVSVAVAVSASSVVMAVVIGLGRAADLVPDFSRTGPDDRLAPDAGTGRRPSDVGPDHRRCQTAGTDSRQAVRRSVCSSSEPAKRGISLFASCDGTRSSACGRSPSSTIRGRSGTSASSDLPVLGPLSSLESVVERDEHRRGRHRDADCVGRSRPERDRGVSTGWNHATHRSRRLRAP